MDLLPFLADDRTEEPTERRLKQAADEGRQADLSPVARPLAFLAALAALRGTLPGSFLRLSESTAAWLEQAASGSLPDPGQVASLLGATVIPPGLAAALAALSVQAVFGCRFWAPSRLKADLSRPFNFSGTSGWAPLNLLANSAASVTKLSVVVGLAWFAFPRPAAAFDGADVLASSCRLAAWLGGSWLALGTIETVIGLLAHRASLRMTQQEVREDRRLAEGDPHVKQHQKDAAEKQMRRPQTSPVGL